MYSGKTLFKIKRSLSDFHPNIIVKLNKKENESLNNKNDAKEKNEKIIIRRKWKNIANKKLKC